MIDLLPVQAGCISAEFRELPPWGEWKTIVRDGEPGNHDSHESEKA
jgi:hypothetical protein